jgi:spermidine/putrescine transport system substrate-binding protein
MIRVRAAALLALLAVAACGDSTSGKETAGKPSAAPPKAEAKERTLHVFVWADYLVPEVVADFEKEFSCKVVEMNFSSNEEMTAKLVNGNPGFDLVCPSDYSVAQLVKAGALDTIDLAHVPNVKNLGPRFAAPEYDPKHEHSVPYQWGVTGIGYLKSAVKTPPHSWKDVFDDANLAAWKGRISMLDDAREVAAAALLALGRSPNTKDEKDLADARALLEKQKASLSGYDTDGYKDALASKAVVVAQGWSGDVAKAQKDNADIAFVVPDEGSLSYVDNWAIPKGAPDKALAESFIDYLLRPDVAAKAANASPYASTNEAARAKIDPAILSGIAYEDGHGKKLFRVEDVGPAVETYKRLFESLKSK